MEIFDILLSKKYKAIKKDIDTLISETLEQHRLSVSDDRYAVILGVFAYHLNVIESSGGSKDFASYRRCIIHTEDIKQISSSDVGYKVVKRIVRNSLLLGLHDKSIVIDVDGAMHKTKLFIGLIDQNRFIYPSIITLEWALHNQ